MNIVLASDNNFVQHCSVTMVSILKNNKNVVFYLLTEGLSRENKNIFQKLVIENGGKLNILIIQNKLLNDFPMPENPNLSHISLATYYRLFIVRFLPPEVEKVIYLDCDIVVRGGLDELWQTDINEYALGAVYQHNEWAFDNNSFRRLKIPKEYGYFNAGVLLINLNMWRENDITTKFLDFIKNKTTNIICHDQDVLNAVLYKETKPLSCNYNVLGLFFSKSLSSFHFPKGLEYQKEFLEKIKDNPTIVHFVFRPKPWEYGCNHPYKKDYYYYLSFTPWKGWKPKVDLKKYYLFIIKPLLINFYFFIRHLMGKVHSFYLSLKN